MGTTVESPLDTASIELSIGGMTCASCAARIEKKLNRLLGVTASVNFATEKAWVAGPPPLAPADLVTVVEQIGYSAAVPTTGTDRSATQNDTALGLRRRLVVSAALSVPIVALAMVPAWQFPS